MGWIVFLCVALIIASAFWYEKCYRRGLPTKGPEVICIICCIVIIAVVIAIGFLG